LIAEPRFQYLSALDDGQDVDKFPDEVVKPIFARTNRPLSPKANGAAVVDSLAVELVETWCDSVSSEGQIGGIVFYGADRNRVLINFQANGCFGESAIRERRAGGWRKASSEDWHIWSH
jgi:hypothetical protein